MAKFRNIVNETFNKWMVIERAPNKPKNRNSMWLCRCVCGNINIISAQSLRNNSSKQCLKCSHAYRYYKTGNIPIVFWKRIVRNAIKRKISIEITKEQAYELLILQNFQCAITKLNITLPRCSFELTTGICTASLDRINNKLGYIVGNVQWLHKEDNRCPNNAGLFSCDGILVKSKRENIWLGTSPCNQDTVITSVPPLLNCKDLSAKLFLSVEPILGEVYFNPYIREHTYNARYDDFDKGKILIDWVIVGGESGSKARECKIEWIETIVFSCSMCAVPVFVKQLGSKPTYAGELVKISDRKGDNWDEWPATKINIKHRAFP